MTRAEIDTKIATLRLTITLADGVCESACAEADDECNRLIDQAEDDRNAAKDQAEEAFEAVKAEAEAEIARLEGLEVTE